ncbi:MAG: hypothetical protein C5B48_13750 [Candidatus Rokuibacteriota bacterium]|nr:MAG: hypothetical protein C5B48_13750 [Candidatus Rokubacteria bacterium]
MRDRSLKQEMSDALRGDRERAEARRKAEAEGAYVGPAPPTLDLNAPTREWKLPEKAEDQKTDEEEPEPDELAGPVTQDDQAEEPEPEEIAAEPAEPPAATIEPAAQPEPEPEPAPASDSGLLARLRAALRR